MRECIGAATISRPADDNPHVSARRTASPSYRRAQSQRLLLMSASVALMPGLAAAQTWTGATSNDWTVGSNWNGGTVPAGGAVSIVAGSTVVLGVTGPATGTTGTINVRDAVGAPGSLTIQNGSTLTSTGTVSISDVVGGTATVTVTGAGSRWNASTITTGTAGTGILNITDGATVTVTSRIIVTTPVNGTGTLKISNATLVNRGFGITVGNARGQINFDNATFRAAINTPASRAERPPRTTSPRAD
ncbi:hypothetical protein [Bradyrhizobium sp. 2S1]|uniref:hypothetical protein n=1 Tax=Bradyrhizobium sp. 2S1 TaxID=1404429 RepID=UPI00140AE45C|nr:hypothetical protein [Bradyrhizobium sp. 2S1]MCK7668871.1 hypothetical protein [Bradyrhizobium sp. 2S1]